MVVAVVAANETIAQVGGEMFNRSLSLSLSYSHLSLSHEWERSTSIVTTLFFFERKLLQLNCRCCGQIVKPRKLEAVVEGQGGETLRVVDFGIKTKWN